MNQEYTRDKKKIAWDRITAIAAVITAIVSVIISSVSLHITQQQNTKQLELTRTHNKLSVKPKILIFGNLYKTSDQIGVGIRNEGLGPAIIKKIRFAIDGIWLKKQGKEASIEILKWLEVGRGMFSYSILGDNATIRSETTVWLFSSDPSNSYNEKRRIIVKMSKHVGIAVYYCSLYNECEIEEWGKLPDSP
jgi:hypothetical protein